MIRKRHTIFNYRWRKLQLPRYDDGQANLA